MTTRRLSVALVSLATALTLSACGADEPQASASAASDADRAACSALEEHGPDLAAALPSDLDGVDRAARGLHDALGDAGPDDPYSDDLSPYAQIVAADALIIGSQIVSGDTSFGTEDTVDHLLDMADACESLGVPVSGF